tara:strand:- start:193 stop:798 length:606 start_codon:yes stop_codon:yes gene_type:complete
MNENIFITDMGFGSNISHSWDKGVKEKSDWIKWAENQPPKVFIETGTYRGVTARELMHSSFETIHTIEADEYWYKYAMNAVAKEKSDKKITHHLGYSQDILPSILKKINEPCFFFLDAHESTASPIDFKLNPEKINLLNVLDEELSVITNHRKDHIVLCDDAIERTWIELYNKYFKNTHKCIITSKFTHLRCDQIAIYIPL